MKTKSNVKVYYYCMILKLSLLSDGMVIYLNAEIKIVHYLN